MVGRPRKIGPRGKSGRLLQTYVNPRAQVASQPHRKGVLDYLRELPEASTNLGRMMLNHVLTPAQHAAGERYCELYKAFLRAIHCSSPDPSAMDYTPRIAGKGAGIPDSAARKATREYTDAFNAIQIVRWQIVVMHHAVHDQPIADFADREALACGLDRLVKHFGIDAGLQITTNAKYRIQQCAPAREIAAGFVASVSP